jgi:hypothetical protein
LLILSARERLPQLKQYPAGTVVSASFFQRIAVAGMCVGEGNNAAE